MSRGVTFTEVEGFLKDNCSVIEELITFKDKKLNRRLPSNKRHRQQETEKELVNTGMCSGYVYTRISENLPHTSI